MRVTTYQSPSGATIHLTADQVAELERWGVWPRDGQGEEYATVSHGEHAGTPTYSGAELARSVCNEVEARKAGEGKDFRGELERTRERLDEQGGVTLEGAMAEPICSNHPAADHLIERAERLAPGDWTGPAYQLGYLMSALRRMDELGLTPAQYVEKWCGDTGDTGDIRATSGFEVSPVADRGPGTPGTGEVGRHGL